MHTDYFFSSGVQLILCIRFNDMLSVLYCVIFLNESCIYYSKIELIVYRRVLSIQEQVSCCYSHILA
jgi:hypothetical protein